MPVGNIDDDDQPMWVCFECGPRYAKRAMKDGHLSTWHPDTCGVCGREGVSCTEPRDFGYLKPEWREHAPEARR